MTATKIRLTSDKEVLASVPALIGFIPSESVVMIALTGKRVGPIARIDTAAATTAIGDHFGQVMSENGCDAALIVAITPGISVGRAAVDAVAVGVARHGATVRRRLHATRLTVGGVWTNLNTGEGGETLDPFGTEVAAHAVLSGRQIVTSREALDDRFRRQGDTLDLLAAGRAHEHDQQPAVIAAMNQFADTLRAGTRVTDDLCCPGRRGPFGRLQPGSRSRYGNGQQGGSR